MKPTKTIKAAIANMIINPHHNTIAPSELKRKNTAYKELTIDEIKECKIKAYGQRPTQVKKNIETVKEPVIKTVAMEVDIVERKHKAQYKDLLSKYERALKEKEILENSYNDLLLIEEYKKPINIPLTKESNKERQGASLILVSDWHVEKEITKSSVNGMNEYNLKIAKQRSEKFADSTIKMINRDVKDFEELIELTKKINLYLTDGGNDFEYALVMSFEPNTIYLDKDV